MAGETKIVSDLKKINKVQDKAGIQLTKGAAYIGSSIILHHGEKDGDYQYPIQQWVSNLTLQENLYQNGIMGHLDMNDPWNLVRNGIILGQELLYFKFCTLGADQAGIEKEWAVDYSKQPLHVYKITNLKERSSADGGASLSGLVYRLHFCSPEMLINSRVRISKTMQGTVSDMVKNILEKDLQTSKEIEIEATDDLKHIVIPTSPPFLAIKTLLTPIAQKKVPLVAINPHSDVPSTPAIFKGRYTDYYFWETTRGYKFQPCIKPQTDAELAFTVGSYPDNPGWWQGMLTGRNHKYINTLDTLSSVAEGAWGSKQINHNGFTKSYSTYQSNYHRSLYDQEFAHASQTPVYETEKFTKNRDDKDRMISDWPDGKLMMSSFGGQRNTTINKTSRESTHPWTLTSPVASMQREMQIYHALRYNQLSVTVHGISVLQTGMIVELKLPDIGEGSGYLSKNPKAMWENRMNNLWIITEIQHIIEPSTSINEYRCELTLSNTMGATKKVLPAYDKLGGSSTSFKAIWT